MQGALEIEGQPKLIDAEVSEHIKPMFEADGSTSLGDVIDYFNTNLSNRGGGIEPEIGDSEPL